jgi:hypothetical protein
MDSGLGMPQTSTMISRLGTLLVISTLSGSLFAETSASTFRDDFDRPPTTGQKAGGDWNDIGENYTVDAGEFFVGDGFGRSCLRASKTGSLLYIMEPATYAGKGNGFVLKADMAVGGFEEGEEKARGAVVFHYKDLGNFIAFGLLPRRAPELGSVRLLHYIDGVRHVVNQDHDVPLERNTFYQLRVEAPSDRPDYRICRLSNGSGEIIYEYEFQSDQNGGHAGFWREGDKNLYWDDIELTGASPASGDGD